MHSNQSKLASAFTLYNPLIYKKILSVKSITSTLICLNYVLETYPTMWKGFLCSRAFNG